ncbi:MAG: TolC family protein, partial [Longimicrobiales bacterium]
FGTKLRQERFAEADFAIAALNDPDAVSDWTAGLGARWTVGDPVAWAERRAAGHAARAAGAREERTAEAVVLASRMAYLQAVAAREGRAALEAEVAAARATADRVGRRVDEVVAFLLGLHQRQARDVAPPSGGVGGPAALAPLGVAPHLREPGVLCGAEDHRVDRRRPDPPGRKHQPRRQRGKKGAPVQGARAGPRVHVVHATPLEILGAPPREAPVRSSWGCRPLRETSPPGARRDSGVGFFHFV